MRLPQAKHANGEHSWGINGETGKIVDMKSYGLYESASVKVGSFLITPSAGIGQSPNGFTQVQILKTAIEAARVLLRVDDVVQANRKDRESGGGGPPPEEMMQD